MARIPGGAYAPFYPTRGEALQTVKPFLLDTVPVSNAEFLAFVQAEPRWRRSQVSSLFADDAYLSHWEGDLALGAAVDREQPVTFVPWFVASAYCQSVGKRLPSEAEWEFAASPAPEDEAVQAEIAAALRAFYGRPRGRLPRVATLPPNRFGVRDLHGVIWEWVDDFNASLASADNRQDGDPELARFCGGGSVGAADVSDYASFMRIAFRTSLQATYSLHHLGFRCARSIP